MLCKYFRLFCYPQPAVFFSSNFILFYIFFLERADIKEILTLILCMYDNLENDTIVVI